MTNVYQNENTAESIRTELNLENARPLYDGITNLRHQLSSVSSEEFDELLNGFHFRNTNDTRTKLSKIVKKLILSSYDKDTLLRQNPNFGFLTFWTRCFSSDPRHDYIDITDMLIYYDLLHVIAEVGSAASGRKKEYDDLPYLYENLCGDILQIMKCSNCFIIHQVSCGDTHIVARSAYLPEEVENGTELKAVDIAKILNTLPDTPDADIFKIEPGSTDETSAPPTAHKRRTEKEKNNIYRIIPLYRINEDNFYILLQYENKPESDQKKEFIKILFARDYLKNSFLRDYEHLLNLRYELGFLRFFSEKKDKKEQYPTIIHTSDLHADRANPSDENLKKFLSDLDVTKKIDLFVLSGDIVDAKNSNASQTQENYDYAAGLIRKIVSKIWRENDRISFDWKRRIIFVPGNHDFAAMNLVKAVFKQRSLAAGLPYDGNNKIVAKFAYYLNFVQELIDAPIDQLIRNEINEVREYRRMNTKILMLNSSCDASSIRTNKVRVNENILISMTQSETWKKCIHSKKSYRVCVVHHSPIEPIDYTLDGYDEAPGWKWGADASGSKINSLYDSMIKTIDSVDNSYFTKSEKELPEAAKDFIDQYDSLKGSAGDDNIEKINAKGDRENKYYFTKDAKTLYDYFVKIHNKENNENKEYAEKIITNIKFNTLTAQQDKEEYNKCFKTSVSDADLFLCGHIHVKKDLVSKNGVVSIVGKLLSPDESNRKPYYCYRIISARLSTDGETFDTFEINTKYLKKHFKLLKCSRASSFARKNTVVAAHVKHDQAFL